MHLNEKKKSQDLRGNPSQSQAIPGPPGHCAMVLSRFPMILSGFPLISDHLGLQNHHGRGGRPPRATTDHHGRADGTGAPPGAPARRRRHPGRFWRPCNGSMIVVDQKTPPKPPRANTDQHGPTRNGWETTQNHRELTQDHRTMSRNPPQCLELPGIFPQGLEFYFLREIHYRLSPTRDSES